MKYISLFLFFLLIVSSSFAQLLTGPESQTPTQKKIKEFKVNDLRKSDLNNKAFKDHPLANERILFDYGEVIFTPTDEGFTIERSRHLRVKILSDTLLSAHQLGLTSFDKDEIVSFEHYHLQDGDLKEKDLKANWAEMNKYTSLVGQLNDFSPGDILEFRFRAEIESPTEIPAWQFEYEIPVDYSEFYAEVPGMFKYRPVFKGYVPLALNSSELLKDENQNWIEVDGFYIYQNRFVCMDIAPFKNTVYSPSSKNYLTSIDFYLEEIKAYKSYKPIEGQSWEHVSHELYKDERVAGRIKAFDGTALLASLHLDSNKVRSAQIIYNWVSTNIEWNGDIGIYAEHPLDELIQTKSGSIAEINLLLCALLDQAGILTRATILRTLDQGEVNMEFPGENQFNYLIAWISLNGEEVVMDASERCLAPGLLRPICLNNKGLKITPRFEEWVDLEEDIYAKSSIVSIARVKDKKLIIEVDVAKQNYLAFEDCRSDGDIQKLIRIEPGVVISDLTFDSRDSIASISKFSFSCTADSLVKRSGSTWAFNPFWINKIKESPFVEKERRYPIVFPYLFEFNWNFVLELDENVSVSSVPKSLEIMVPDKSMRFTYETKKLDNIFQLNAQLRILKRRFQPEMYEDILDFYDEVMDKVNEEVKIKVKN
jgi:hypothetical protein